LVPGRRAGCPVGGRGPAAATGRSAGPGPRAGPERQLRRRAIASISTRPPLGSAPTAKVERAGGGSGMNGA